MNNSSEFMTLEQMEKEHIERAIAYTNGQMTRAAKILGINRRTLYRKIKVWNESKAREAGECVQSS